MAKLHNPGPEVARVVTRIPEIGGLLREEVSFRADGTRMVKSVQIGANGINHDSGWRISPLRVFIGGLPALIGKYRTERLPDGATREVSLV